MKTLVIYGISNRGGGSETFLYNFFKIIKENNPYKIILYIPEERRHIYCEFEDFVTFKFIENREVRKPMNRIIYENFKVYNELRRLCPDIIFIPSEIIPYRWNHLKAKIVINIHSTLQVASNIKFLRRSLREKYDYLMRKRSLRLASKIVFVSHLSKAEICFKYNIPEKKIVVIYHGVSKHESDLPTFTEKKPYILSVGDLHEHKNYELLLNIYSFCKDKYNINHKLLIIGNKKLEYVDKNLRNLVKELNLTESVCFLDNIDQKTLHNYYANASLYITTSSWESFGITPMEAMIYSIPTIVCWNSALAEVYNGNVVFIDPYLDRVNDMAKKVFDLLTDDILRTHYSKIGFDYATLNTWDKSIGKYLLLFQQLDTNPAEDNNK